MKTTEYNITEFFDVDGKFFCREWRNSAGELHREGGPAEEYADGTLFWYRDGKLHRAEIRPADCAEKTIFIDGREYNLVPVEKKD